MHGSLSGLVMFQSSLTSLSDQRFERAGGDGGGYAIAETSFHVFVASLQGPLR